MSTSMRVVWQLIAATCLPIAAFSIWGFLAAFEPGQEAWRIIYPMVFVSTVVIGAAATRWGGAVPSDSAPKGRDSTAQGAAQRNPGLEVKKKTRSPNGA